MTVAWSKICPSPSWQSRPCCAASMWEPQNFGRWSEGLNFLCCWCFCFPPIHCHHRLGHLAKFFSWNRKKTDAWGTFLSYFFWYHILWGVFRCSIFLPGQPDVDSQSLLRGPNLGNPSCDELSIYGSTCVRSSPVAKRAWQSLGFEDLKMTTDLVLFCTEYRSSFNMFQPFEMKNSDLFVIVIWERWKWKVERQRQFVGDTWTVFQYKLDQIGTMESPNIRLAVIINTQ